MKTEQDLQQDGLSNGGESRLRAGQLFFVNTIWSPIRDHRHRTMLALVTTFLVLFALHLYHLHVLSSTGVYLESIDFNEEHNFPTAFASMTMLFAGCLLISIGRNPSTEKFAKHWIALGVIFIYLAFDEYCMIHDGLSKHFEGMMGSYDFLHFAWVVPYSVLLLVFAASFFKFFFALPWRFRFLFAASGIIFILGAMGFEMLGAPRSKHFGRTDLLYTTYSTIEESLEFIGILLFNYTLLAYIHERLPSRKQASPLN